MSRDETLRRPYESSDPGDEEGIRAYATALREAIEDDRQDNFAAYRSMKILQLIPVAVPDDAWQKVRRRLRLIDAAPARSRRAAAKGGV